MNNLLIKINNLGQQGYQVLKDKNGFYIGLSCPIDGPFYRDSACYWPEREEAEQALASGSWKREGGCTA